MAASPSSPAWSVAVRLRYRRGLEIHASAQNVLPGWGCGGERMSLLLRLRRRLILAVTSQCGPRSPPPGCKIFRFLRSSWARVPRMSPIWQRKNKMPVRAAAAVQGTRWLQQNRSSTRTIQRNRAWAPAATPWFAAAALATALASVAVFYLKSGHRGGGYWEPIAHCASWSWRCFLAQFLEPPSVRSYKWLLRLLKWLLHKY